jgi:hypothetical protein
VLDPGCGDGLVGIPGQCGAPRHDLIPQEGAELCGIAQTRRRPAVRSRSVQSRSPSSICAGADVAPPPPDEFLVMPRAPPHALSVTKSGSYRLEA